MENKFIKYNLGEDIIKSLTMLGYNEPSEVQEQTIPKMMEKLDIIVQSQTGSGKTASYGIPICSELEVEENSIGALILVPTRELALQVKEELGNIGRLRKIRCAAIFGKQPFKEQERELKQRIHIVAGTPGRVMDHMNRGNLDFSKLKYVVIDEADKMLNMGFIDQVNDILKELPKNRETALFSATIPDKINILCEKYMKSPIKLNIKAKVFNRDMIHESHILVANTDKISALKKHLYGLVPTAAIVFCNTREKVREVYEELKREGISVNHLHGDMEQKDRIKVMESFKNGEFKVLVATDVAARGIHVDHVTHVINFEVPMEQDSYVHRIGRTGRAGKEGTAITFCSNYEKKFLNAVEEYIGYKIPLGDYPSDDMISAGKKKFLEPVKIRGNKKVKKAMGGEVTKLYLRAGKKKKIRNVDLLGALSNLPELTGNDIGIIDVQDNVSYVDIINGKGNIVLKNYSEIVVKGRKVKLERARK